MNGTKTIKIKDGYYRLQENKEMKELNKLFRNRTEKRNSEIRRIKLLCYGFIHNKRQIKKAKCKF